MTIKAYTWETELLDQAQYAAQQARRTMETVFSPFDNPGLLERAYRYCERVTAYHSRTFHLASGLLPGAKRRAARALYAFCRRSDDLVDRSQAGEAHIAKELQLWRNRALGGGQISKEQGNSDPEALTLLAWTDTRHRYRIPQLYAEQLIQGIAADLGKVRYQTFDQLAQYCYGVASTVGLMSMHIIGFTGPEAIPYAIRLGVALQLTNILRDVGEDWRNGRFYLPLEELAAYHLTEDDIARGQVDDRWRTFMRFQLARARRLYEESWPGVEMLNQDGRFAIGAAAYLYRGILDEIEKLDYDNFNHRAHVSTLGKLGRLPGIWLAVR